MAFEGLELRRLHDVVGGVADGRFKAAMMGAGLPSLLSMAGTTDIPGYIDTFFNGDPQYDGSIVNPTIKIISSARASATATRSPRRCSSCTAATTSACRSVSQWSSIARSRIAARRPSWCSIRARARLHRVLPPDGPHEARVRVDREVHAGNKDGPVTGPCADWEGEDRLSRSSAATPHSSQHNAGQNVHRRIANCRSPWSLLSRFPCPIDLR